METATEAVTAPARRKRGEGGAAERVFLDLLDRHLRDDVVGFTIRGERVDIGRASGDGVADPVALTVHNDRFFERVLSAGNLGLGESYMDGDWDMEEGDIGDLLTILLRNRLDQKVRGDTATAVRMAGVQLANLLRRRHWGTRSSTTTRATTSSRPSSTRTT